MYAKRGDTDGMEDMREKEAFRYTYRASEQEEVKRIREKYAPGEPDKLKRLRTLDRSAARKGMAPAITVGTLGTLVFGVGMCCTLVWADRLLIPGIIIGVAGMAAAAAAYPLYIHITKKERERIAPEILRLTDELMK